MKNDKNKGCDLPQERNTMDYLDEIKEAWENTDSYTKEANNYDIQHYVEYGGYESDAFARWWEEGLSDTHYLDDIISEVHHIESVIAAFLKDDEDSQYYRVLETNL